MFVMNLFFCVFVSGPPPPAPRDASPFSIDRLPTMVDPANLRAKFNARLFGANSAKTAPTSASNRKASLIITTKNHWVPPKKSIMGYLSAKVSFFVSSRLELIV